MKNNWKKKFGMSAEMKENSNKDKGTTEIFSNSKTVSMGEKKKCRGNIRNNSEKQQAIIRNKIDI